MKLLFCLQINTKVFYKLLISFWVCVSKLSQSTQNNKFAMSLQYLKENGKNEVGFLLSDKHQRFLQIDTITLGVVRHAQIPKITSLLILCNILRKKWVMKLISCMHITMKVSCKLILWFLWGWSSIPKVAKISSLYNAFSMIS